MLLDNYYSKNLEVKNLTKNIIETENLTFKYINEEEKKEKSSFRLGSIEVKEGEFLVVLGHNGSGKSTMAKHMNALLIPTEGTIYVAGLDTKDENNLWDVRSSAGMVFQNPDNQLVATIVEEDAFWARKLRRSTRGNKKRVEESLKKVGMYEYREHAPHLLSGGQKQRIAIAGILAMMPKCIIFDEPTAMLDPSGKKKY